jgi:anti-anti-sigma regulatory factor
MKNVVVIEYRPDAIAALETAVLAALQEGAGQVVLDLNAIEALDTDGVRGLIKLLRSSRAAGGELALSVSKPGVGPTQAGKARDRLLPKIEAAA